MNQVTKLDRSKSIVIKLADKYGVDSEKMLNTLKQTAFKQRDNAPQISNEQMMALLIVADQHNLNPFTKEIYAFPDKKNGIIPIVGVDGWSRIINEKPTFDGMEFRQSENIIEIDDAKPCPEWIECAIFDRERNHPVTVREYLDEVYREPFIGTGKGGKDYKIPGPWQTHTKRMLRHKAMIQCARIAYGFGGIYDQDEGERIIEGEILREQISPEPIDFNKVQNAIEEINEIIEADEINMDTHIRITALWEHLSNDERCSVYDAFNRKISDHPRNKKYKTIIDEHLNYHPSAGEA